MAPRTRHAVWCLGAVQCIAWGVLYYGFPAWLLPMQQAFALPAATVAAAFSGGLAVAAWLAPRVGRAFDRGQGRRVLRAGLVAALAGLALLALARGAGVLFLGWALLGGAMSALLYEPAFALVQRAVADPAERLRALAAVTVMGGLASTVFLPLLGVLVQGVGLAASLLAGAVCVAAAGILLEWCVLPALDAGPDRPVVCPPVAPVRASPPALAGGWRRVALVFSSGTVAAMALASLLVPHLVAAGEGVGPAASVLGVLGLSQLPGRVWLLRGGRTPSPGALAVAPLGLQAAGLGLVALASSRWPAAAGVALFGLGAGLQTLARPWLVQARFGDDAGYINGRIARWQGLGRAAAPFAAVAAAAWFGSTLVLGGLAVALGLLLPLAHRAAADGARPPATASTRGYVRTITRR